ncbi:MAG: DUF4344 domain-containing metallopeptidase [Patescibacteria group bacterium]
MRKIITLLFILGLVLIGCGLKTEKPKEPDPKIINTQQQEIKRLQNELNALKENQSATTSAETLREEPKKEETVANETTLSDLGDFKIMYGQTKNPNYAGINNSIKASGVFEKVTDTLNLILVLQKDFPITFAECGFANAYYTSETKEIIICDELLEQFGQNFAYFVQTEAELDQAITDATYFILYHELGHGLIDIYNLNYSGREEDVVDQLSTLILALAGEDGTRAAIAGANYFYITSSQVDTATYPFWDTHSMNQQRYYNILCWVYGSNPKKYSDLVGVYGLPQERAVWCQREYQKISDFWDITIYPYLQEEIKKAMEKEGTAPK